MVSIPDGTCRPLSTINTAAPFSIACGKKSCASKFSPFNATKSAPFDNALVSVHTPRTRAVSDPRKTPLVASQISPTLNDAWFVGMLVAITSVPAALRSHRELLVDRRTESSVHRGFDRFHALCLRSRRCRLASLTRVLFESRSVDPQ